MSAEATLLFNVRRSWRIFVLDSKPRTRVVHLTDVLTKLTDGSRQARRCSLGNA